MTVTHPNPEAIAAVRALAEQAYMQLEAQGIPVVDAWAKMLRALDTLSAAQVRKVPYARNLFAVQKLLSKGFIRNSEFDEVLKIIDDPDAERTASLPKAAPQVSGDVEGWLIELKQSVSNTPTYYGETEEGVLGTTTDHMKAIRFSRKVDAERVLSDIGWTEAFVSMHGWS